MTESPLSSRALVTNLVLKTAVWAIGAALCWLSFRIFGGGISFSNFAAPYSCWFAAGLLIFSFFIAIDAGGMRLWMPDAFAAVLQSSSSGQDTQRLKALLGPEGTYGMKVLLYSNQDWRGILQTPGFVWIASMAALRGVFAITWLITAWAALGRLVGMSRARAMRPLAFFFGVGVLAALVVGFFQMAPIMVDPGRWLQRWS